MSTKQTLRNLLFNNSFVEKIVRTYTKQNDLITLKPEELQKERELMKTQTVEFVKTEFEKAQALSKKEAYRYRIPTNINSNINPDRKPESDIPFSMLRRMAQVYPVARACINRRVRQITQLDWEITTIDDIEGEKGYERQIGQVKEFLKQPMGHKTRFRELLTIIIDDILTVDAVCFEEQRTFGGNLLYLVPVDPTTIALRVTRTGATPEPPEIAYAQFIRGEKVAEFTTEEMIYDSLNSRSFSPYGLAPLESLIIQVESALRGAMYNLDYFRESNVPEGFVTLPEDIVTSKEQVEQWQLWFDAMLAGDRRFMHRLKILPSGSEYTPAKKPEDMAFERFELWMLQLTCAMFDVPPQDIGITYQVNKATAESQNDLSRERGLFPLSNFIKELLDDVIQQDLNLPALQFSWTNLNPVDRKEEAEIAEKDIRNGVRSVDEIRIQNGLQPIGLGHYIMTASGPMLVTDIIAGKVGPVATLEQSKEMAETIAGDKENGDPKKKEDKEEPEEDNEQKAQKEVRAWKKAIFNDLKEGRDLRVKFPCKYLDAETHEQISESLKGVKSKHAAKLLFDSFLDPELRSAYKLLNLADRLRSAEEHNASISN